MVAFSLIAAAALALMNAQGLFMKSTKTVNVKESVMQEFVAKAAIIQSQDALELQALCNDIALGTSGQGNCLTNTPSQPVHPVLYQWIEADPQTKICIELTRCTLKAEEKIYEALLTVFWEIATIKHTAVLTIRKAK